MTSIEQDSPSVVSSLAKSQPREMGVKSVLADLERIKHLVCTGRLFPERRGDALWRPPSMRQLEVARHQVKALRWMVTSMLPWRTSWGHDGTLIMRWVSDKGRVTAIINPDCKLVLDCIDYVALGQWPDLVEA